MGFWPSALAHHADPPRAAGEGAKAAADLDPVLAQQRAADSGLVDALRDAHRQQRVQLLAVGREALEAQYREGGAQRLVRARVTFPARGKPFLLHDPQPLVQRVDHVDGRGVVVGARAVGEPVVDHRLQVEVPRAALQPPEGAVADRERREAWWHVEALLRAGERGVDAGRVEVQRVAGQRGDAVHQEQPVMGVDGLGQAVERLGDAGRGLAVDDEERARGRVGRRLDQGVDRQRAAPLGFDLDHVGARARQRIGHPPAERAVDADDDALARRDQGVHHRLHPAAARRAQRERDLVGGLHRRAQQRGDVVLQRAEGGVEMPDRRMGQGLQDALGHRRRAGAEQQAGGDVLDGRHARDVTRTRYGTLTSGNHSSQCSRSTSVIQRRSSRVAAR